MSIFSKVLASVGIGTATVDTKLQRSSYIAGEIVSGVIEIKGGNTEQQIDSIYLTLLTNYTRERNDTKYNETAVIKKIKVNEAFTIRENEFHSIPFSFVLPADVPVTMGKTRVWILTGLDIKNSIDPTDQDFIEVKPTLLAANILSAVEQLGFRIRKVDCESAPARLRRNNVFVQEFEFVPTTQTYRRHLDELEIIFLDQSDRYAEILLQVDRKARGLSGLLSEALEMDESFVRVTVEAGDNVKAKIQQAIERYM